MEKCPAGKEVKERQEENGHSRCKDDLSWHARESILCTEALCRHMRWPLAWGAKVEDDCIRCPLHQTTHKITDGELVEWSPFPLFPPYGKLVGKMSRQKNLTIYETRVEDSQIQVYF